MKNKTFKTAKKEMTLLLQQEGFDDIYQSIETDPSIINSKNFIIDSSTSPEFSIKISFPGYKSGFNRGKIVYDYRVDFESNTLSTSLSHVNLIIDLYTKCKYGNLSSNDGIEFLIDFFANGDLDSLDYEKLNFNTCDSTQISEGNDIANNVHSDLGKSHNETGNSRLLTPEEFCYSLKYIAIQEDVNYPIPRYQGRKMCLKRYLEVLYICDENYSGNHSLSEIITRALKHGAPPTDWPEMSEIMNKVKLKVT